MEFSPLSAPALPPCLSVVIHDVAPATWGACVRLLRAIERNGDLPLSLLAVPRYHGEPRDRSFEAWLRQRQARGDEIVLHGYTHLDEGEPRGRIDRLRRQRYTRGEGEFAALPEAEARARLQAGLDWLKGLGIEPQGFIAPAWLASEGTWQALQAGPFSYSCTLTRLVLLPEGAALRSQAQVWSDQTVVRRELSLVWNALLWRWQRHHPLLRLELHPTDADQPATHASWQGLLRQALRVQRRRPLTLAQLAQALRRPAFQASEEVQRDA